MQQLKFGLNLQKKKTPITPQSRLAQRASAFAHESDEEEEEAPKENVKSAKAQVNRQLSGYNTMTKKLAEQQAKALEEDPTIFDYDAVYDDLKDIERKKQEKTKPKEKKAKYIQGLLEMAEIRKRDRVLAEEKKVAREREAEGDEFADREVFVTESFKKQKEELERIEREEKEREQLAEKNKTMDSFYKQVLERKEAEHQVMIKAMAERKKQKQSGNTSSTEQTETDIQLVEQAKREGKEVLLNDNNEIVDKRQLLGAGLNVKPKFGSLGSLAASDERIKERMDEYEAYKRKKVEDYQSRRRQGQSNDEREQVSKEVERQIMQVQQEKQEEEERKQKEFEQKVAAKRTTEDAVMSARERYLARKKQRLEGKE
ncbi:coiled-coil domain-containing protein 55-domain containing protein [Choanephora cucurbitarum]|nr:coiled-coil domain-containing protein 55-domain containing protein [Choanephora cucurbitarum]